MSAGGASDAVGTPLRTPRVFGVGLSRTGTTSLNAALVHLGYRARHFPSLSRLPGPIRIRRREYARYDAFTDLPPAFLFRELDARFPGAKFVLTVRDEDAWLASCARFERFQPNASIARRILRLREAVYGCGHYDEERFRATYRRHLEDVRAHFAKRPANLLELDVCAGAGFEALCRFLDRPLPSLPFPHENRGEGRPSS